jgi:MipA family protein
VRALKSLLRHAGPLPVALLTVVTAAPAAADQKPLWEFGLGTGVLVFNDYRGADTTHAYPLPLPYFIYRGDFLKADRDGVRGKLFNQDRIEINLSVNATTPVRNDSARSGMPDLRSTLEIGPQLNVHLWRSADELLKLDVRVPVRAAFTVEASPHMIGTFIAPSVALDLAQFRGEDGWKLGLLAGPLFADHRYDSYFYTVAPQYATAARSAYEAPGGYAGAQALAALTRRFPKFWIGLYIRHDSLGGASFAASPLVKRDSYWSGGLGFAWMIKESSVMVESQE